MTELGQVLHRQGLLAESAFHLGSAVSLQLRHQNFSDTKGITKLANTLGGNGNAQAAVAAFGRTCRKSCCGDADGSYRGWTLSSHVSELITDTTLAMQPATVESEGDWASSSGRRRCRSWRGAVPGTALQSLRDHMREGAYLPEGWAKVSGISTEGGADAGYASWWAPLSERETPSNLFSQIACMCTSSAKQSSSCCGHKLLWHIGRF